MRENHKQYASISFYLTQALINDTILDFPSYDIDSVNKPYLGCNFVAMTISFEVQEMKNNIPLRQRSIEF